MKMTPRVDRSWVAAAVATACIVVFASFLFVVARSFRSAFAEIAESGTRVTIINADGSVFYDTDDVRESHATREEVVKAFDKGQGITLRHSQTLDRDFLYCARKVGDRVVRLAVPYTGVIKSEHLVWVSLGAAGVLGASLVFLVFFFVRRVSSRLDEQARRLEIAAENERFRREFTSNVTHELKSPLTSILGAAEMLDDGATLKEGDRTELFGIIKGECRRLNTLVGDVLSLAQIERAEEAESRDFVPLSLSSLVEGIVRLERTKAAAQHVAIDLVRNDAAMVNGDALRLEEAVQNLIANALRYSGSDRIEVSVVTSGWSARVTVSDFGVGIPSEHVPHLFERFYRVSKSRSRSLGGTGLGLAIVKHIVRLHGGEVYVSSLPGVKTSFGFRLPLIPAAPSGATEKGEDVFHQ